MHHAVEALVRSLSAGKVDETSRAEGGNTVSRLAKVYEVARNALEYRADHLVRRAAIERILRRKVVFEKNTDKLSEELLTELRWAMYMTEVEEEKVHKEQIKEILDTYIPALSYKGLDRDWLLGMTSAAIEERFNPNSDYQRFTTFAFNVFKPRVKLEDSIVDLVLFVALDRVYSQSDEQQVSYHLYKLVRGQAQQQGETNSEVLFSEAWKAYQQAMTNKELNHLQAYVRRHMGPLVLLRDMYFYEPQQFAFAVSDKNGFETLGKSALESQLKIMGKRIRTAMIRSLIYVFLTKMLIAFLVEVPLERLLTQHVSYFTLGVNMFIPILVMLAMTATARLPKEKDQDKLVHKAWLTVSEFDNEPNPWEIYPRKDTTSAVVRIFFYGLYGLLFAGTFVFIMSLLVQLGYNILNLIVFLFFVSVVSFFAFRIRQTALIYSWKSKSSKSSLVDTLLLPIVVVGGVLSSGVAKLNFLVFIFDFVLEAPFKIILKFLDNWFAFLSARKDEVVG